MKNVYTTIKREMATRDSGKIAIKDGSTSLSYAALFKAVDAVAIILEKQGVGRTSRVALFCGDSIDYITASLAVLSLQAVVVPVPPTSAPHEVEALLKRIGADFLLFDATLYSAQGEGIAPESFIEVQLKLLSIQQEDVLEQCEHLNPAFIRFSSGTTGESKGVLLSHETILERTDAADKGLQITAEDTILWVLSMSYHFVVSILLFLRRGATISLCYKNFPLSLNEALKAGEGTFIYAAPVHYYTLTMSSDFRSDSLKKVRMAISTSMKLRKDVATAFQNKFNIELTEAYGIIEVGLPFVQPRANKVLGSVGRLLPDFEVQIQDKDADGIGQILIRGKGLFDAYLSPWKEMKSGEWFDTGDLGRMDELGNLFIAGRKKSVINCMGMKVFPDEVEATLDRHPCVAESFVFGQEHPRDGQWPMARVVLSQPIDEDSLKAFCAEALSSYKVPKRIEFVDQLVKTANGKLFRD